MLLVCFPVRNNSKISIPVVCHNQAVICRRSTISGASVRADTFIEPSRDHTCGSQIVNQVVRRSNCKVNLGNKFMAIFAIKPEIGNLIVSSKNNKNWIKQ